MAAFQQVARTIARRVNTAVWVDSALPAASVAVASWATVHILLQLTLPSITPHAAWLLAALPASLAFAWGLCRRKNRFFEHKHVVEIIDHLYLDDGAVTAYAEAPERLGASADDVEAIQNDAARAVAGRLPRIQWRRYARRAAPALIYAAAALLVPPRPPATPLPPRAVTQQLTRPLEEKLEEYRAVLPEEQRQELEEQIEVLKEDPKGISREQWEALEEIEKRLDTAAKRGENQLQDLVRQLSEARSAAARAAEGDETDSQNEKDGKAQDAAGKEALANKELGEKLAGLAQAGQNGLSQELSQELLDALKDMEARDAKGIAAALSELQARLEKLPGGT